MLDQEMKDWLNNPLGETALLAEIEWEKILTQVQTLPVNQYIWDKVIHKWLTGKEMTAVDYAVRSFLR